MKTEIHPNYYVAKVTCACGNSFTTRSTRKEIRLEICGGCHPFYTGKQRLVDTAGRVERFQKRFAKTEGQTVQRAPKAAVKKKIDSQAGEIRKQRVLSTAPKTEEQKGADKKGKGKDAAKPTKKA